MTNVAEALMIHQLLGRIVYFHALFIEPALQPSPQSAPGERCCNHGKAPGGRRTVEDVLRYTAWRAVDEVAATVPARLRACPEKADSCCATCRVVVSGAAIAETWAEAEHRAYYRTHPSESLLHACAAAAAVLLGRSFANQHRAFCEVLDRATAALTGSDLLPSAEGLPLTGELLALWANPIAATQHPVASWLNHCTSLDDLRRVRETRRTGT